MPSLRKDREINVKALTQDMEKVQGMVVAGYVNVKTPELNDLRAKLRPIQGKCQIVKNTLARIALKNNGIENFGGFFEGQSALVICRGDALAGFKVLVDFAKGHENLKIRAGYLDGKIVKANELKAIAALPPRTVLLSRLLGQLQAPLSRLHGALSGGVRGLAGALGQVAKVKEKTAIAG